MKITRMMKRIGIAVGVLATAAGAWAGWVGFRFGQELDRKYETRAFQITDEVKRADASLGKRLYTVRSGCIDCHGPDGAGMKVMEDPAMGSIHGANITPSNLASWSDEEIARAIRYGVHRTGRSLRFMPAMDYEALSLGDTAALVAYLRSLPAVERPSHENRYGPVARALSVLGQMPVMFPARIIDQSRPFGEKPAEGATPEFGRYLAHACVGCHGTEFKGGKIPGGDPKWPHASNIRLGSDPRWTEAAFRQAIQTGVSPISGQKIRMPMPVALLAQMDEKELGALWAYLGSLR